jgi:hypothetical protein
MSAKVITLRPTARTRASSRIQKLICEAGLTQDEAGKLRGKDARQVRRWLSGKVSLGALELVIELEDLIEAKKRRAA